MVDILLDDDVEALVDEQDIIKAVGLSCLLAKEITAPILCVRFSNNAVVQELNATWRDKNQVTDVLSFPMQEDDELEAEQPLGDIIIAVPFVSEEAIRLALPERAHCIHLIVHGTLHLLGFDHCNDADAEVMQALENKVMKQLGLHKPYSELSDEVCL